MGHKPTNTLRNKLCNLKDKRKPQDAYDAIYKIRCTDCEQVYIGETGKTYMHASKNMSRKLEAIELNSKFFNMSETQIILSTGMQKLSQKALMSEIENF